MDQIRINSQTLAAAARLARNTLTLTQRHHLDVRNADPGGHAAHGSEQAPCCLMATFEAMARRQVESVEYLFRQ